MTDVSDRHVSVSLTTLWASAGGDTVVYKLSLAAGVPPHNMPRNTLCAHDPLCWQMAQNSAGMASHWSMWCRVGSHEHLWSRKALCMGVTDGWCCWLRYFLPPHVAFPQSSEDSSSRLMRSKKVRMETARTFHGLAWGVTQGYLRSVSLVKANH